MTPSIRSGKPVTIRRCGAASKSVKLIVVKTSKAISRSCKHLATPVPGRCCHVQKNAFLQFLILSCTSCSGNAFSNLARVLETRARQKPRQAAPGPWLLLLLPVPMTQSLGLQDPIEIELSHLPDSRIHLDLPSPDPAHAVLAGAAKDCIALNVALAGTAKSHTQTKGGNCSSSEPNATRKENNNYGVSNNFSAVKRVLDRKGTGKPQITLLTLLLG